MTISRSKYVLQVQFPGAPQESSAVDITAQTGADGEGAAPQGSQGICLNAIVVAKVTKPVPAEVRSYAVEVRVLTMLA